MDFKRSMQSFFFLGSQLWKLDEWNWNGEYIPNMLQNYKGHYNSIDEEWNFKNSHTTDLFYIENISQEGKVFGIINIEEVREPLHWWVILEDIDVTKPEQLWKKGEPNSDGYFTLENAVVHKVLTVNMSGDPPSVLSTLWDNPSNSLEIKGNILIPKTSCS